MDTLNETVVAPAAVEAPRPRWARPYASARTRASVVAVAFGVLLSLLVLMTAANLFAISQKTPSGRQLADDQRMLVLMAQWVPATLILVAYLLTGVSFCVWMHRVYRNLPAVGGTGLRYSPRQAVLAWFVPILNLFRPYQITREIWRAVAPAGQGWGLLKVWWALWLFGAFGGAVILRLGRGGEVAAIAADAIYAVTAILALLVVLRLTTWQEQKAAASPPIEVDRPQAESPPPGGAMIPVAESPATKPASRYGLRIASAVLGLLTLLVLSIGLGVYAARAYEIAHWTPIVGHWQDQSEHFNDLYRQNLLALTSLQRKVSNTVGDLDHPSFTMWNSCEGTVEAGCPFQAGDIFVGGVPDTFTFEINFRATVPVKTYIMASRDFACWYTGDCRAHFAASWAATTTLNAVFHEGEGCAEYLAVFEPQGSGTLYPNVIIVNNPASHLTGVCAK